MVRYTVGCLNTFTTHPSFDSARESYDKLVDYYADGHKPSITGVELRDMDGDTILRWVRDEQSALAEDVALKFPFKIHGVKTANGKAHSASTGKFYTSEDAALARRWSWFRRVVRPKRDWHKWYAWFPVRVHDYHFQGRFPLGPTVGWAWLEPVWRRWKQGGPDGDERVAVYVIARYAVSEPGWDESHRPGVSE